MADNTIYMMEKDEYPKDKKPYHELVTRVYFSGRPETAKEARLKMSKPLVKKVEGPFNEKDELVEETEVDKTYIFKATKFQKSTLSPIKNTWWAAQIDGGDICDLETNKDNLYLDSNKNVCFKYKVETEKPVRIYAYGSKPLKEISILINPKIALETILIIGTEQHSANYGNKLMFPAQAIREARSNFKNEKYLTVILFTDGYNSEEKKQIKESLFEHNKSANYLEINSTTELIKYLNDGDEKSNRLKPNSDEEVVKIGVIKIFAHGLPSIFDFGLDGKNQYSQRFQISDVLKLNVKSFRNTEIYSYACRTGNVSYDEVFDKNWESVAKPNESLAQKLADFLNATVYGYIKRSNYTSTWNDGGDEAYKKDYEEIEDESVTGRIYKPWDWDEVLWHDNGAYKAPKSGNTPLNLPNELYKFQKRKKPVKSNK
jgi:hypothetical protein